jgi:hypothetical protein
LTPRRAARRSPRAAAGLGAALLCAALAMTAPPQARAVTKVGYPALRAQISSGPVIRAVINPATSHVEIKFRDQSEWIASFPPGAQPGLQRLLRERHIPLIFASRHRAGRHRAPTVVHHHLRYIAAGVLAAVLLIGGGALAYRRRSPRSDRGPSAPQPPPV